MTLPPYRLYELLLPNRRADTQAEFPSAASEEQQPLSRQHVDRPQIQDASAHAAA